MCSSLKSLARAIWSVGVVVRFQLRSGRQSSPKLTHPFRVAGLVLGDRIVDTRSECTFEVFPPLHEVAEQGERL